MAVTPNRRHEDHWPWYFRLLVRFLDRKSAYVIAPDGPWKDWVCRDGIGPYDEVRRFVEESPTSAFGLNKRAEARYPVRTEAEIFAYYQQAFARASELLRQAPDPDAGVLVLLLLSADIYDCAIIVSLSRPFVRDEVDSDLFSSLEFEARIDFRRMPDGSLRTSAREPRERRHDIRVSDLVKRAGKRRRERDSGVRPIGA
ncbi:MAG TPA: hypothetical protein VF582_03770 [Allosphingosinicella sp.]|jgi:hypothetical protein